MTISTRCINSLLIGGFIVLSYDGRAQIGSSLYTIPVIVHVLHQNGMENISDAQIYNALELANNVFDLTPMPVVEPPFDVLVADMEVRLCLASIDPSGAPTTGIERIETPLTEQGGEPESYVNGWPPDRYLNIWVVSTITTGQAAIGTAPATAVAQPLQDGIMILHNYMGTIGTGSLSTSRALPYALARYLDLKRLYEVPVAGGPCGDDEVSDTPKCRSYNTCDLTENACDTVRFMEENIMSTSYCSRMFTIGQRDRVHACLNSSVAGRSNLSSPENLASTGCGPALAVEEQTTSSMFDVYPSPFVDHLTFNFGSVVPERIVLCDAYGRVLRTLSAQGSSVQTSLSDLSDLAPGTYLVLSNGAGQVVARKVLKL
ncbi:MAG: zinc-dependent metalloprotease [Flavobacteriales bacterium]|nr:zinc-dependent metalloprotease [Flavobacteriales bacterium]